MTRRTLLLSWWERSSQTSLGRKGRRAVLGRGHIGFGWKELGQDRRGGGSDSVPFPSQRIQNYFKALSGTEMERRNVLKVLFFV